MVLKGESGEWKAPKTQIKATSKSGLSRPEIGEFDAGLKQKHKGV